MLKLKIYMSLRLANSNTNSNYCNKMSQIIDKGFNSYESEKMPNGITYCKETLLLSLSG